MPRATYLARLEAADIDYPGRGTIDLDAIGEVESWRDTGSQ